MGVVAHRPLEDPENQHTQIPPISQPPSTEPDQYTPYEGVMAPLEDFESVLKEVVQARKLSASKMGKLTEIALKSMEHDTQLVSVLYRLHKSLPPAAKVSSLYVFDALCRAARHQVNKQNLSGDINSANGNSATFLLKVEGVLEGLFQDMIMVDNSESKEKTKKILDIWVKGNTFPSKILSRLMDIVKEKEKEPEMKPLTTSDPRASIQPLVPTATPPKSMESPTPPVMDPQATLLALLTQAANAAAAPNASQTTANTTFTIAPGLEQLAALQQLALAQTASNAAPSITPSQLLPQTAPAAPDSAFPASSSYRDESYNTPPNDQENNRRHSPERVNAYSNIPDDRYNSRGGFRGGLSRGRGRGDTRSNRWDDRDRDRDRYKDRDRDWTPPNRGRRSRSRSPPSRYGGRRDVRPYSPPRRSNPGPVVPRGQRDIPDSDMLDGEKDEFGRDIRPQSPESDRATPVSNSELPQKLPPVSRHVEQRAIVPSPTRTSNHEQMSLSPLVAANTSSSIPNASVVNTVSAHLGMESFDPMTFNFTSPSSWEVLGKMWQVTHGYLPTTEQLMQFVMSTTQASMSNQPIQEHNWSQSSGQGRRGRGRGFIRGNFGNGNTRHDREEWTHNNNNQATDAIVLGETTNDIVDMDNNKIGSPTQSRNGGSGGRMQRIGDKWVFVRDSTMEVS